MTKLCQEYGLSDNGLRKICKALAVPTPPAGHWMKLEAGKPVERTPLPPAGGRESYVLEASEKPFLPAGMRSPITADLVDRIAAEADDTSRIVMPPAGRWHSALIPFRNCVLDRVKEWQQEEKIYEASQAKKTLRSHREPSMDGYRWQSFLREGSYLFPKHRAVAARVTLHSYERGLAVLNALCFAAESRGFSVEPTVENSDSIRLEIEDVRIWLRVGDRTGFELFHEDGTPSENGMGSRRRTKPKGTLRIYCHVLYSNIKVLDESVASPWENRLNEVFVYLYRAVARAKEKILSKQIAEAERRAAVAKRDEERRLQEELRQNLSLVRAHQMREKHARLELERALLDEADRWREACVLKDYIGHIEQETQAEGGAVEWLSWARDVLRRLDPAPGRIKSFQRDDEK
ncbi:hypothetical protein [Achromobacter sp. Root565]|uniref:hypothetical protein n=1 Tax=Achromobacter sp. Root565 TaxID=1736564 RepID=UPI000B023878|nr:hypothetical protein [Achromobacter sp. Root565]